MKKLVIVGLMLAASCWFLRSHRLILEIREYNRGGGYEVIWQATVGHPGEACEKP